MTPHRLVVECPHCERPVTFTTLRFTTRDDGCLLLDATFPTQGLLLHIRFGCDGV